MPWNMPGRKSGAHFPQPWEWEIERYELDQEKFSARRWRTRGLLSVAVLVLLLVGLGLWFGVLRLP